MSKTVEELAKTFRAGLFAHLGANPYATVHEGDRAGIAAVIRALRDEFGRIMYPGDDWNRQGIMEQFDQILGEAVEKVVGTDTAKPEAIERSTPATDPCPHCKGEGCTPHLDRKGNVYPEPCQHCETTGRVPATAPAPAVCVWTRISEFDMVIHYSTPHGVMNDLHLWRGLQCSACHAPIKFTEAK